MSDRMRGVVKSFRKGYGFIVAQQPGINVPEGDIFCHFSFIQMDGFKTLKPGQIVEFDLVQTDKGFQAHNVVVISDAGPA